MGDPTSFSFSFEAIGTHWQIDIHDARSPHERAALFDAITQRIEAFDRAYSRFRNDSLVTEMSRTVGMHALPEDAVPMMDLYARLYRLTDGAFTPLIGSVMEEAGYDAAYSLTPRELHTPFSWDEAMEYRFPALTMKKPALLDFGAAGKGYLIDCIGALLHRHGVQSFIIDAGGDILHKDKTPIRIRVGLEHPDNPRQIIGVVELGEGSICGSAGNRRAWDRFHHIIDPRTLESPRHILSVWVTAKTAMIADALATCLFLVPVQSLSPHFDFEYAILSHDHSLAYSPSLTAEIFTPLPQEVPAVRPGRNVRGKHENAQQSNSGHHE